MRKWDRKSQFLSEFWLGTRILANLNIIRVSFETFETLLDAQLEQTGW